MMSRKTLKLIAALALLLVSTAGALAQGTPAATTAEKFTIRNLNGQTITLTGPSSGVSSYALTFPASVPAMGSLFFTSNATGTITSLPPSTNGFILSLAGGTPSWVDITTLLPAFAGWSTVGNGLTNPLVNFLGTTNSVDFVMKTNSTERLRVLAGGGVTMTNDVLSLDNTGTAASLRFYEPFVALGGSHYTSFQAGTQSAHINYTLPTSAPTSNGQMLSSTTAGVMSWASAGTVSNFSAGDLAPLFTTSEATTTTTPALSFSLNNQAAATVFAGPVSGGAAAPTFRTLTTTDIPSGLPYVSSVAVGSLSPLFTTTNAGTALAPSFTFAPVSQAANLVYASPNGAAGNPTFRALVSGDIPPGSGHYIQNQTALQPTSNFHISGNGQIEGNLQIKGTGTGFTTFTGGAQGATTINYTLPAAAPTANGQVLSSTTGGVMSWATPGGGGTVTNFSAGDLAPLFTTSEATTTTTPALSFALNNQSAATVFAGPVSGGATAPTFRALTSTDIPDLSGSYIKNQTSLQSSSNFHISGNGQIEGNLQIKGTSTGFTTFTGGAQGASNITYTLPTAQGSAGSVLTNNGSGALSWASVSSSFQLDFARNIFDDFVMNDLLGTSDADHSTFSLDLNTTSDGTVNVDQNAPTTGDYMGRVIFSTDNQDDNSSASFQAFGGSNKILLGEKVVLYETRVRIETLSSSSPSFTFLTGFSTDDASTTPANAVNFTYNHGTNGGNWTCVTRAAGTTSINSGVAVVANQWYILRAVITPGSPDQVDFYIDDNNVGTSTTNIPTNAVRYTTSIIRSDAGNSSEARTASMDWLLLKMQR